MKRLLTFISAVLILGFGTQALGAFNPTGGGTYRLQSSITSSQSSITLSSFKEPVSNLPYTMTYLNSSIEYATIEPQSTTKEFISFTGITQNSDGTATLTGVSRGLGFSYPFTASTTLRQSHPAQAILILSNPPQLYNQYANKGNDETITGTWTFSAFPVTPSTPAATVSVAGFTTLATGLQAASSTAAAAGPGGTTYVLPTSIATDTPTRGCSVGYTGVTGAGCVPIGNLIGKLSSSWIPTASSFTWTGTHTFSSSVNLNATTTINTSSVGVSANIPLVLVSTSTQAIFNSNNASTTIWQYPIQGNTLGKNDTLRIHAIVNENGCGGAVHTAALYYGNGSSTTTLVSAITSASPDTLFEAKVFNKGATNTQGEEAAPWGATLISNDTTYDTTANTYLSLRYFCTNGANATIRNVTVEKLGSQ